MTRAPRRVVVTDAGELLEPGAEVLRAAGVDVDVVPEGTAPADAADRAADAPAVIVGVMRIGSAEIGRLRATRLLVRAGIGYDVIDVAAATEAGIWVANVPDYCVDEVADHAILLLLAATRRLAELTASWRDGWAAAGRVPPVHRIRGRRLGIVGLGRIGRGVATRARGFGWEVVAHDPFVGPGVFAELGVQSVGLEEMFETADAVTLHSPLTDATRHLVGTDLLARVRPGLVIVNTSRGGLVDLAALDAAIEDGRVAAAGLDVLEDEPQPNLMRPLLTRSQVIVTPHLAWYSLEARRELAIKTAEEALRLLDGERPRNIVNPEARAE
ncbi:MAG TPA: C-terminal binding protein [Candidatus Limnocylindrales bacterium]|nr:C-terminal binding protein [Candidatus Limnocylindrales bacterium]